jgi:hypothetical protein
MEHWSSNAAGETTEMVGEEIARPTPAALMALMANALACGFGPLLQRPPADRDDMSGSGTRPGAATTTTWS